MHLLHEQFVLVVIYDRQNKKQLIEVGREVERRPEWKDPLLIVEHICELTLWGQELCQLQEILWKLFGLWWGMYQYQRLERCVRVLHFVHGQVRKPT